MRTQRQVKAVERERVGGDRERDSDRETEKEIERQRQRDRVRQRQTDGHIETETETKADGDRPLQTSHRSWFLQRLVHDVGQCSLEVDRDALG